MISAVGNIHPLNECGRPTQTPAWIGTVRNVLTGRVFPDWKSSLFVAGIATYVIRAVFSFFSGYWLAAIIDGFTAYSLASFRREYQIHTDLHKTVGDIEKREKGYRLQNDRFSTNNRRLEETKRGLEVTLEGFQTEVLELREEKEAFRAENGKFKGSNEVYAAQIKAMETIMGDMIQDAEASRSIGSRTLKQSQQKFKKAKEALEKTRVDLQAQSTKSRKQLEKIAQQICDGNATQATLVTEQQAIAQATSETIAANQAEIRRLDIERARLEKVVARLEEQTETSGKAADRSLAAAERVEQATQSWFRLPGFSRPKLSTNDGPPATPVTA